MLKRKLIHFSIGFLLNSILIFILSQILLKVFKIDFYDTTFFSGIVFVIIGSYIYFNPIKSRVLYAKSPETSCSNIGTDNLNRIITNINIEAEKAEKNIKSMQQSSSISKSSFIKSLLLDKTPFELITFGVLMVGIGFTKYSSYF